MEAVSGRWRLSGAVTKRPGSDGLGGVVGRRAS
jgi:hypothetical protein